MTEEIIGVDPGGKGCAVRLRDGAYDGSVRFKKYDLYTVSRLLFDMCSFPHIPPVYLELVNSFKRDTPHTAFEFGRNTGNIEGMLIAHGAAITEVAPRTWQLHFGIGGKIEDRKRVQKRLAQALFPDVKVTDDMADAMLIAQYGWDTEHGVIRHEKTVPTRGTGIIRSTAPRTRS